jgi:hypothetical protein
MVTLLLQNVHYLDHSAPSRGDGSVKGDADGNILVAE